MIRLARNELFKMLRLKKMGIFMFILVLNAIITVYYYQLDGNVKTVIVTPNGQSLPLMFIYGMAQFMAIFIPVYVTDIITEEYRKGTLKLSLLRPVSRVEWLHAKIAALLFFIVILVGIAVLSSYAVGTAALGWGDRTGYGGASYLPGAGVWLTLKLYALMILPYMACGMIVVWIAICCDSMSVALVISIGLLNAAQYLNAFEEIKPYSIVNQMYFYHESVGQNRLGEPAIQSTVVILIYLIVFYLLSVQSIKRKDLVL